LPRQSAKMNFLLIDQHLRACRLFTLRQEQQLACKRALNPFCGSPPTLRCPPFYLPNIKIGGQPACSSPFSENSHNPMAGKKNHVYTVLYWFFCSLFSLSLSGLSLSTLPFSSAILKCHTHTHLNSYLYTQIPMLIKYFCCWIIFFFEVVRGGRREVERKEKLQVHLTLSAPCAASAASFVVVAYLAAV